MWAWQKLGGSWSVLDTQMKDLQNFLQLSQKTRTASARAKTTDATVTTLETIPVPVDTVVHVTADVVARRTGGSSGSANDGAAYTLFCAATNSAGTAALIGSVTVTAKESQAGWDCTIDANGGNLRVRVTGAANNDIQWRAAYRTFSVKE